MGRGTELEAARVAESTGFRVVAEVVLEEPDRARIYEHGWQSWSPAGSYPATITTPRPRRDIWQTMAFRPNRPAPPTGAQGEGLLAVSPEGVGGPTRTWLASDPARAVASIRADVIRGRLEIAADGPVAELPPAPSLDDALAAAGDLLAAQMDARPIRSLGPGWCSWYGYGHEVTDRAVAANIATIERERLDIGLIQVDDGYQANIGDWLEPSGRIADVAAMARRIRDGGREAGIWTAPFMVGSGSRIAREHPDWLVRGAVGAAHHWGQRILLLDVTHPDAAAHLDSVYRALRDWGFTYHKLDFLYAGAMAGGRLGDIDPVTAYRTGLQIIRAALGEDATIVGCGAPLLPSIGLVDAMRVSPDTDHRLDPPDGDISQPSMRGALCAGRARAWMHGRLWVNDPDCIIASPEADDRETWAEHLGDYGGLAMSGDRLADLDARGLEITRTLLRPSAAGPLRWDPDGGPDGGRVGRDGEGDR
jgi:alpha-galactosidase